MNTFPRICVSLLTCALVLTSAVAQKKAKSLAKPSKMPPKGVAVTPPSDNNPRVNFTEHKLKNGLRVFLVEDHSAPVVSIAVNYNVGSRNERQGRTGFAHLFEHMMFQGSQNIGKSEHFILVQNNGGTMNGTTNTDRTIYFESLPANQLDLILFLEADRMKSLDISKENLDNQRNAVQEERRLGVDNQPYGKGFERFETEVYDNFAYKHSVIGSMADLNAASVDDVSGFFKMYYAPNNAVLALVGDFDSKVALEKIKAQYEGIAAQPTPPSVDVTEPEQKAERRFTEEDALAQIPALLIGYKGNFFNTPDEEALQVLDSVLTGGRSSRLYQKLVKDKQLVVQIQGGADTDHRGPSMFGFQAFVSPGKKTEEVEAAIYEEIAKLQTEPIADWELEKAKNSFRTSFIRGKQSSMGLAMAVAESAISYGSPKVINEALSKMQAVTKEDVQRVAKKYFSANNRTVFLITPAKK
jgi:zinc protease